MIKEVDLGVDTDAMSADIYHDSSYSRLWRAQIKSLFSEKEEQLELFYKLKKAINSAKKEVLPKIISQVKSIAFT